MSVLVAASAVRTCFGDADATYDALIAGRSGVGPLRHTGVGVTHGYHIDDGAREPALRASTWLSECVARAVAAAGLRPDARIVAVVGSGLRELRAVERYAVDGAGVAAEHLHFGNAVRTPLPGVTAVHTIVNACSAGGYALALGQDLIELGQADAVVVGGADSMTESMLAMIGRVADEPTDQIRPFDQDRSGVLLGEGAAAVVLVPEGRAAAPLARLLATGVSCDAVHETAPDVAGIVRAMADAMARAGRTAAEVELVFAHGTGTALNDPTELAALREVWQAPAAGSGAGSGAGVAAGSGWGPAVTAIKGAIGHTSGASALHSLAMAILCLRQGLVPPVVGLRKPLPEAEPLRLVTGSPLAMRPRLVQVDAFGFGGVNAVSLIEPAAGPA
ncbi:MAG TPA: beta-ketoacyl synthase N-terminal-like domain-containing protein [Pilimelia sp.]|nr:beta-ketoacyl synthase N-terminal-like domain-containing protein [Pilimelia sp.]